MPRQYPIVQVFQYNPKIDCLVLTQQYKKIAEELGITEWNPVVWIGRLFALDQDPGEHWFDDEELRLKAFKRATKLGYRYQDYELFPIDPDFFRYWKKDPEHSAHMRKRFWTDVLSSFKLSLDTLFAEARDVKKMEERPPVGEPIKDLERRIKKIEKEYHVR